MFLLRSLRLSFQVGHNMLLLEKANGKEKIQTLVSAPRQKNAARATRLCLLVLSPVRTSAAVLERLHWTIHFTGLTF